jgi:exopolysaccharide production protein ExoZ
MPASARIAVLQVLRAVAALLVAQTHVIDVAIARHTPAFQATFGHFENFGAVGVDIFFAVSGFIVPLTALSPTLTRQQFAMRRIVRIYPIWWIALLAWLLDTVLRGHSWNWHLLARSALLAPALNPNYAPVIYLGWSLIFEMFFYLLIVLTLGGRPSTRLLRILIAVGTLGLIGAIAHPIYPLSHVFTNPILLEFCGGLLIGLLWTSGRMPRPSIGGAVLAVGTVLLLASGYFGFGEISEMENIINGKLSLARVVQWGIPSALIVFGALSLAPQCNSWAGRILVVLGDASYSIYLTSFFTRIMLYRTWRFLAWMPGDLAILVSVGIIAVIGTVIYLCLEKPVQDALKPLTKRRVQNLEPIAVTNS